MKKYLSQKYICKVCGGRTSKKRDFINHQCNRFFLKVGNTMRINDFTYSNRFRTFQDRMFESRDSVDDKTDEYYKGRAEAQEEIEREMNSEKKNLVTGEEPLRVGLMFPDELEARLTKYAPTPHNKFSTSLSKHKNQNIIEKRRRKKAKIGEGYLKPYLLSPTTRKRRSRLRKTLPVNRFSNDSFNHKVNLFNLTFPAGGRKRKKKKKKKNTVQTKQYRKRLKKKKSAHDVLLLSQWKKAGRTIRSLEPEHPEIIRRKVGTEVVREENILPFEEYTAAENYAKSEVESGSNYYSEDGSQQTHDQYEQQYSSVDPTTNSSYPNQQQPQQQQVPRIHLNTIQGVEPQPQQKQQQHLGNPHMNTIQGVRGLPQQQYQQPRPMNTIHGYNNQQLVPPQQPYNHHRSLPQFPNNNYNNNNNYHNNNNYNNNNNNTNFILPQIAPRSNSTNTYEHNNQGYQPPQTNFPPIPHPQQMNNPQPQYQQPQIQPQQHFHTYHQPQKRPLPQMNNMGGFHSYQGGNQFHQPKQQQLSKNDYIDRVLSEVL